jgi:succinate dehydrogenase / fumarate reductase cytochrome b subunit
MANADMRGKRPLSPHLQIYKLTPTMVMSIAHRIAGAALYFGTLLVAAWLVAAASGPEWFDRVGGLFGSRFGLVVLFGYTLALMHHMLGGIRHLIWDTGRLIDKDTANRLAAGTLAGSITLTILIWIAGFLLR